MKCFTASLIWIDESHDQRRSAYLSMQLSEYFEILRNETRLKEQILWRIPSDGELRRQNEIGSFSGKLLVGRYDFCKIAPQITDGRVDLSKADLHARQRRLCAWRQAAKDFAYLWGASGSLVRCS